MKVLCIFNCKSETKKSTYFYKSRYCGTILNGSFVPAVTGVICKKMPSAWGYQPWRAGGAYVLLKMTNVLILQEQTPFVSPFVAQMF